MPVTVHKNKKLGIAVVGAGYWGPNLIRNFASHTQTELLWVCDRDLDRARRAAAAYPSAQITENVNDLLNDSKVHAVAIATPPDTHAELAAQVLSTDRHILVEKPLAHSYQAGLEIVDEADRRNLVVQCDHTFCYTPAVLYIKNLLRSNELGDLYYYDSVRVNLGLVQTGTDVFGDLAPHDLSILDFILQDDCTPTTITAQGSDPIGLGHACMGYIALTFPNNFIAHLHVNWLSPTKVRTTTIGGSRKMLIWDDLSPSQRVTIFEAGVDISEQKNPDLALQRKRNIAYRTGDMYAPALDETEALTNVIEDFVNAIHKKSSPKTGGHAGLRVLKMIEAAQRSFALGGKPIHL